MPLGGGAPLTKSTKAGRRAEPPPTAAAVAIIARIEELGFREETCEEYDARLSAWRGRLEALRRKCQGKRPRAADIDKLGDEPDVDDLVPDKEVTDFDGMDDDQYAALLLELLPGKTYGFAPSAHPDRPTPARHDRFPAGADDRPPLTDAFVRCLQRRVRMGMALTRPEDAPRKLPGRHDT